MCILNETKVKSCKDVTKIISEKKNRCTVNDFIFACSFIYLFIFLFIYFFNFCRNHLIFPSDVIICTGYTIFANTLNLLVSIFRNSSKK